MKFKVTKAALLDGLHTVQNVVGSRTTLPILNNVLLTVEDSKLWLTTTDLEVTVRCAVEVEVESEGMSTLPVKRLSGIVRELPDAVISVAINDSDVATLECGTSHFRVNGLSRDEFPPVASPDERQCLTIDQGLFRDMLRKTSYAASTDETRYVLNGVLLSFRGGKLTVVATDGRRLALAENEVEYPDESETDLILPSKAVQELLHVLRDQGEMKIHVKENQVVFEFGDVMIASKLIDGTYPNYRQVIPTQCEQRIAVERETLQTALRRASIVATDKTSGTKLTFSENKLTVVTTSPEIGEARETVAVKYSGKPLTVAFNADFMLDPLRNLTCDEVYIELTDELSPGVIKCDVPFLYVLMPMRLN